MAAIAITGCGQQGVERNFGTFTDCASIGRVSSVADPAGDQRGTGSGPQGDLVGLRLSRGRGRLCIEFKTRGPIRAAALFGMSLRPQRAERPALELQIVLLGGVAPEIILKDANGITRRHLSGTVGIRSERMSVVIERAAFAQSGPATAAIFDDFRWQVRTAVAPSDKQRLTDCAVACR